MTTINKTKTAIIKGAAFSLFATLLILAISASAQNTKVTICHIPSGNPDNKHELVVSSNAVNAHLGHGDFLGPCEPEEIEEIYSGLAF